MKVREVLVIGAGISGCAAALALAKRGIPVTILTSSLDERIYHAPFIQSDHLEEKVWSLQQGVQEQVSCLRATEQLIAFARKSTEELLDSNCLIDRNGNIDIHRSLQDQLKQIPHVEWIANHTLLEIITLHQHSSRKSDMYKSPMCLGITALNCETHLVETILAKEVIMATGGATALYPFASHPKMAKGQGLAIAWRAGARLLKMDHIQFHPLALFERDKPCFPLPLELLFEGGQLSLSQNALAEIVPNSEFLTEQLYEQLLKHKMEHLWLNLTMHDAAKLKEKFPGIDAYCLDHGYNIAKDPLPVVPVARYTCGGIAVDRVAQTNVQRLRAIGEAACTGLVYDFKDEAMSVLESLSWALSCADHISDRLHKFIYYFPEINPNIQKFHAEKDVIEEDWNTLKQIMWNYAGIKRDADRLSRGCAYLKQLQSFNTVEKDKPLSIERVHLANSIQTALLITKEALRTQVVHYDVNFAANFSE